MSPTAVAGRVVVPHPAKRSHRLLGPEVAAALLEVVVEEMSKEGWPGTVHHPMHHHFSVGPVGCVRFVLRANVFVVGQLSFLCQFFRAVGRAVTLIDRSANIRQRVVASLISARMKVPVVVR